MSLSPCVWDLSYCLLDHLLLVLVVLVVLEVQMVQDLPTYLDKNYPLVQHNWPPKQDCPQTSRFWDCTPHLHPWEGAFARLLGACKGLAHLETDCKHLVHLDLGLDLRDLYINLY